MEHEDETEWHGEGKTEWHGEGKTEWHGEGKTEWHGEGKTEWHSEGKAEWHGEGKTEWNGDKPHSAGDRGRERERENERKKVQSIHKQVVACPSKRPRTLWLYKSSPVGLPTPTMHCTLLPCLLSPSSVAFSYTPSFHPSFWFRDIAWGRGAVGRYSVTGAQGCDAIGVAR